MWRRCEPLYEGDTSEHCGARFDDARRLAVCPHLSLDGGDKVGLPPDPTHLRLRARERGEPVERSNLLANPTFDSGAEPAEAWRALPALTGVRQYGVHRERNVAGVVDFLNGHRELQPVAVTFDTESWVVLYVQVLP